MLFDDKTVELAVTSLLSWVSHEPNRCSTLLIPSNILHYFLFGSFGYFKNSLKEGKRWKQGDHLGGRLCMNLRQEMIVSWNKKSSRQYIGLIPFVQKNTYMVCAVTCYMKLDIHPMSFAGQWDRDFYFIHVCIVRFSL